MLRFIKAVSDTGFGMINAVYHDKHFDFYRGYISGEARLPSSVNETDSCLRMALAHKSCR